MYYDFFLIRTPLLLMRQSFLSSIIIYDLQATNYSAILAMFFSSFNISRRSIKKCC